jgi:hypothetical protein
MQLPGHSQGGLHVTYFCDQRMAPAGLTTPQFTILAGAACLLAAALARRPARPRSA